MAKQILLEIPLRYEYANFDEIVVMPNHVYAIIIINNINNVQNNGNDNNDNANYAGAIYRVST